MLQSLHLVLLGAGKTGSLVAEVARERGHRTTVLTEVENPNSAWLTPASLADVDAVVDFTTPDAVLANIAKCVAQERCAVGNSDGVTAGGATRQRPFFGDFVGARG